VIITVVVLEAKLFMVFAYTIVNFGKGPRAVVRPPGDMNITDP